MALLPQIFNNEYKKLKLVPDLGNQTNFLEIYQKIFVTKIFDDVSIYLVKNGNLGVTFKIF